MLTEQLTPAFASAMNALPDLPADSAPYRWQRSVGPIAQHYLDAARVPDVWRARWHNRSFGLWQLVFHDLLEISPALHRVMVREYGCLAVMGLHRWTNATLMRGLGECVMEDSPAELARHLPLWLAARGRVLITGLGLGCCVRGALANPAVEHIDVVELEPELLAIVGEEFRDNPRVTLIEGDAIAYCNTTRVRYDVAWHDLWTDTMYGLHRMHVEMIAAIEQLASRHDWPTPLQGAWAMPRQVKRVLPFAPLLGGRRRARRRYQPSES